MSVCVGHDLDIIYVSEAPGLVPQHDLGEL
jgi:hypothetical protein